MESRVLIFAGCKSIGFGRARRHLEPSTTIPLRYITGDHGSTLVL
jgi:hypothetical protein